VSSVAFAKHGAGVRELHCLVTLIDVVGILSTLDSHVYACRCYPATQMSFRNSLLQLLLLPPRGE
jgi:hypothetical protein